MGSFGICFVSLLLGVPFVWIQFDVMRLCEMRLARISFDLSGSFLREEVQKWQLMLNQFGEDDYLSQFVIPVPPFVSFFVI